MRIEVAYCLAQRQTVIELELKPGCTAHEAIEASGLMQHVRYSEKSATNIGLFGKKCSLQTVLQAHDRVEIYRDLMLSPTEARKLRAKTLSEKKTKRIE